MEQKLLNNGIKIPILGMGTDKVSDGEDVYNQIKSAIKIGYRLIDTAELYHNETGIGRAIKDSINEGVCKREDLFIQTKAPFHFSGYNNTYKGCLESLERLGLDYVDMYLIHHPYRDSFFWDREVIDIWRAMENLYKEGKVKAIGVCNFNTEHLSFLLKEAEIKPMLNQIEFHPQHQKKAVIKFCKENNITLQGWGTLNQGRFLNEPMFEKIAQKYNKTPAQIAIRYSIQNEFVPLIRTTREDRMIEEINVFDFELTSEDIDKLNLLDGGENSNNHMDKPVVKQNTDYHPVKYLRSYKLFNFIPILTKKRFGWNKTKWFLFGFIPLLKTWTKEMGDCK